MNLRLGAVPDAGAFDPEAEGFVSLREPDDSTFLAASIPVSWVIFVLLACGWEVWWPGGCYLLGLVDFAFGIVAVIVVHEWIHALTLPDQGAGENTVFGFYPRHLIFYTQLRGSDRSGPVSSDAREPVRHALRHSARFLRVSRRGVDAARFVSLLNGVGCAGDILGFFLILRGVPKNAIILNKGSKTW